MTAWSVDFGLPLQGSLDNMSIIIINFPGAPKVSQDALQHEAEVEQIIDTKVGGESFMRASSQ